MNGRRRALLGLIAAGALSTAPVALAGGNDGNGNGNGNDGKITICHATGSATNPYVEITISVNALPAHRRHQDGEDIIPAPARGCPDKKKDDCKKHDHKKGHNCDCKKDDDH